MSTNSSPLTEADPRSLEVLFNQDPSERGPDGEYLMTDEDIDKIVEALRADRKRAMEAEAAGKKPPRVKNPIPEGGLDLSDLDL